MQKPVWIKISLVAGGMLLGAMAVFVLHSSEDLPFNNRYDPLPQTIHPIKLADSYDFAGENIPIDYFDVSERLERELLLNSYMHSHTLLHLKLAQRYFPLFERVFAEQGIPDDMKYLAVAESSLRNAVSYAGAKGIWQFKEEAAKELDLEINACVDERNHPEKASLAACKYLRKMKERFGSWTLAAAAYNMGPTALQKALAEQKESNYYDLNLSEETNRYVFRIVAMKEIMANPEKFGFYIRKNECYPELTKYDLVEVSSSIPDLADFAHEHNITYRQLKLYNPWLIKSDLQVANGKKYSIKIPK